MGHSDISVTLNTYTHLKFEDARAEVKKNYEAQLMYFEQFTSFEFASDFFED